MTTDFLDEKRSEISNRMADLQPSVDEYHRLEAATLALDTVPSAGNGSGSVSTATARVKATKPSARKATGGKRGRPKGSGKRGDEAVAIVKAEPGITTKALAERMGLKQPNYLYRVLPALEAEGRIVRDGKGWKPADD